MPKVTAWKCPYTGKFFDLRQRKKIGKHLAKVRASNNEERWRRIAAREFDEWSLNARTTIDDFSDLEVFIVKNANHMSRARFPNSWRRDHHRGPIDIELKYFNLDVSFRDMCSNTHAAPICKPRNFCKEDDKPLGYKGWYGRLVFAYKGEDDFWREALEKMSIHTGSGGGGTRKDGYTHLRFDVTIWADDWPALYEAHKMKQVFDELAGN